MFDFKVRVTRESHNTIATLKTDSGVTYQSRFYCGQCRTVELIDMNFTDSELRDIKNLFSEIEQRI